MFRRYIIIPVICAITPLVIKAENPHLGSLQAALENYVSDKDARIGIAVIDQGRDTVTVNGNEKFPMLSVYKFLQAVAVADYCQGHNMSLSDSISISADEIKLNTWSPLRDKYGVDNLRLPLSELLQLSLQQSDNNACDILFRIIGGPAVADSLMNAFGHDGIDILYTVDEMHQDLDLCYQNSCTPIDMARLFDRFYRRGLHKCSPVHEAIGEWLITCATGVNRLPAALSHATKSIGHKTGTGDKNEQGRIIGVNDAGCVFISGQYRYSIAVFISDSAYDMAATEKMIADISGIVYRALV